MRLNARANLEARVTGEIVAVIQGYPTSLGSFGAGAADCLEKLRAGLPIADFDSDSRAGGREMRLLVGRLANLGLLEFRLGAADGEDLAVIEPQTRDYWPRAVELKSADRLVLSRFAYLRRRGVDMVLESPRAAALFRICSPQIAAALAALASPKPVKELRRQEHFPGLALLGLLLDSQMLLTTDAADGASLRRDEGDDQLSLWDFHDLLFHARSTEGRHANLLGGAYPHAGAVAPLPAVRPSWTGKRFDLPQPQALSPFAEL
ncbi:MAG TPA: dehydrogenase, partial [Methylocystis sp.]|nr:dehydrogenase [Methylocystis sp.]